MSCISPYYTLVGERHIPVPCGRCPPCKKRRVDGWVFRLLQQDKVSSSAHFITLTYDADHVPISPHGFMTLTKGHSLVLRNKPTKKGNLYKRVDRCCFTRYIKRLRKISGIDGLKYYAVGEYGSINMRPHWHAIVFGCPDRDMFFKAWHLDGKPLGGVHVGEVSGDSIAYTMKYIDKQGKIPAFDRDDRIPEFSLMSKGLGKNYVSDSHVKRYYSDDLSRNYLVTGDGHKIAMPRYYRENILDDDQRAAQGTLAEMAAAKQESELYAQYLKHYPTQAIDFGAYKDRRRMAITRAFYNKQKERQ